jgi:hypothetical protein
MARCPALDCQQPVRCGRSCLLVIQATLRTTFSSATAKAACSLLTSITIYHSGNSAGAGTAEHSGWIKWVLLIDRQAGTRGSPSIPVWNRQRPLVPHIPGTTSLLQTPLEPSSHFHLFARTGQLTPGNRVSTSPSLAGRGQESPGVGRLVKGEAPPVSR